MSKRKAPSAGMLDKYPNFMSWNIAQAVADTLKTIQVFVPIPRIQGMRGKATVIEVLWIDWFYETAMDNPADSLQWSISTGPAPTSVTNLADGATFATAMDTVEGYIGGGPFVDSGAMFMRTLPRRLDLQSKDGFGILLASDSFYVALDSLTTGVINTVAFRLYYRFVDITIEEYVGIVQSQMSS